MLSDLIRQLPGVLLYRDGDTWIARDPYDTVRVVVCRWHIEAPGGVVQEGLLRPVAEVLRILRAALPEQPVQGRNDAGNVEIERPAFEIISKYEHIRIYASGAVNGVDGAAFTVINRIPQLVAEACARCQTLPTSAT